MASEDLKVAGLKKSEEMDHYLKDIMSNCFQRREKVRKSGYAKKVLDSWKKDSYELERYACCCNIEADADVICVYEAYSILPFCR